MSFSHNHLEKGARTQIHSLVLPPGVKTPTVGAPRKGPACYSRLPIFFRMATHISPIPRSTVIWFGCLEFMSTGLGYNMILLLVRGPGGACVLPAQSKAPRRPHHHASPPKRRHDQHHRRPTAAARSSPRAGRATVEEPIPPHTNTAITTTRRQSGHTTVPRDSAPRAPSALLPHGLFAARRRLPFGLDNAATSLARTICPDASTCIEQPLALPHNMETRRQAQQVAERPCFPQIRRPRRLGPGRYTLTTLRQQLAEEGCGCFYTAEPDPDSESDSYDPTRDCFNVDGAVVTTDDTEDTATGTRAPIAGEDPKTPGNNGQANPPPQDDNVVQLAQLQELKAKLDED